MQNFQKQVVFAKTLLNTGRTIRVIVVTSDYFFRYTKVGILILFLHDITDVILEGTKLFVYYKTKGGCWYKICDALSTVGFIMFGVTW